MITRILRRALASGALTIGIAMSILCGPALADHLRPVDVSPPGASGASPALASAADGGVVAVWREQDGSAASIMAATRTPDGTWSAVQRLSAPAAHAERPAVEMDAAGNAVAVWHSWVGGESGVYAAVRPAGGSWGAAGLVSPEGRSAFNADVAVEAGRATIAWAAVEGTFSGVEARALTISGGTWTPVEVLSTPDSHAYAPRVALADDGSAIVVWRWWRSGYFVVQATHRSVAGAWSTPHDLSAPGADASPPRVAMDATGAAVAVWLRPNGANVMAQASYRAAGGEWEPARNLSHRGRHARTADVDMNRAGDAIVAWRHAGTLFSSSRPRGTAGWRPRVSADPYCTGCRASIALDEEGNAVATWSAGGSVEASFKPVGEDWQTSYLISDFEDAAYAPDVVAPAAGQAVAAWVREGREHDRIQALDFDIRTSAIEAADSEAEGDCLDEAETDEEVEACEEIGDRIDECYENAETEADYEACEKLEEGNPRGRRILGTPANDVIIGTPGNDVIFGFAGTDRIDGRGGHDVILGGGGSDRLIGGTGADRLSGDAGADRLVGGGGSDRLQGGAGGDRLVGNSGADKLLGRDRARDSVFGGRGLDRYRLDRRLDRARSVETRL